MPRFVILTHDFPVLHWDLMLEKEAALRTWRLLRPADSAGEIPAELLSDHRIAYLDYEGPVTGNRGRVDRWDRGDYRLLTDNDDLIEVELQGERLSGRAVLRKTPQTPARSGMWRFYFTASSPTPSS